MMTTAVIIVYVLWGYSMAFGDAPSAYWGGLGKAFLSGVTMDSQAATFSAGVVIPEYVFIAFQMTFACITPALIVGAFAERIKFGALMLFILLWVTLIYFPIAHMVWYWAGPDAIGDAAKAVAAAGTDAAAKAAAEAKLAEVKADAGLLFSWGALDFAGGTVVHINAGIAGLVGCLVIGKRIGYGKELMPPHSLVMTLIGAALLWVGWFGFNAGSNLEANGTAAMAALTVVGMQDLASRPANEEAFARAAEIAAGECQPRTSVLRASREYRLEVLPVLVRRGLARAAEQARARA